MEMELPIADAKNADFAEQMVWFWVSQCRKFLQWQRTEVVEKTPAADVLATHRRNLRSLLHTGRLLYADVADPESALTHLAPELSGKLLQLQESWDMIHNPMPDAEAEALLKKHFPE